MRTFKNAKLYRLKICLLALLILVVPVLAFSPNFAKAAELQDRSITIGTSVPSAVTTHRFDFTIGTAASLGSIQLEYCTNTAFIGSPCTVPPGFDASAAVISAEAGEVGFSIHPSSTSNNIILTRAPAMSVAGPVSYTFSNVTNPSTNQSVFVRLSTYATTDATGPLTDNGAVVFVITSGLGIGGFVPPYLAFCAAITVGPQCSSVNGSYNDFGNFAVTQTKTTTTQFSGATNDPAGYNVFVLGTTMTAGTHTITANSSPSPSTIGSSQFGINLRDNSSPNIGNNPTGVGTLLPTPDYGTANNYKFQNGDLIASSPLSTDYNIFTVSYIVNISSSQEIGRYSTTMTYLAVANF